MISKHKSAFRWAVLLLALCALAALDDTAGNDAGRQRGIPEVVQSVEGRVGDEPPAKLADVGWFVLAQRGRERLRLRSVKRDRIAVEFRVRACGNVYPAWRASDATNVRHEQRRNWW